MIHPREKITFIRVTQTQDSSGELVNTEAVIFSPRSAIVKELSPSVDLIVQQQNITAMIQVELRYNEQIPIINGDKIEWRGFRFNALAPKVDRFRRWITIKAFSEIETTDRQQGAIPGFENNLQALLQFQL